jgi:hypothetical protein
MRLWTCTKCGFTEETRQLVQENTYLSHTSVDEDSVEISEKKVLRDMSTQRCPFCREVPGATSFVGHVCHHLEETSLSVLPQQVGLESDPETGSGAGSASTSELRAKNATLWDTGPTAQQQRNSGIASKPPPGIAVLGNLTTQDIQMMGTELSHFIPAGQTQQIDETLTLNPQYGHTSETITNSALLTNDFIYRFYSSGVPPTYDINSSNSRQYTG